MLLRSCYRSFLCPYSHLSDICHLVPDFRIIVSMRQRLFSLSFYLRQNTLCFVIWSVFICLFSLSFCLRQNTICFVIWSVLNCFFSLSFYLKKTLCFVIWSIHNYFFSLSFYFTHSALFKFHHMLNVQLFLRPHPVLCSENI